MRTSWSASESKFKSPLRMVVRFLIISREKKARKCQRLKQELDESKRRVARQEADLQQQREQNRELKRDLERLEIENLSQAKDSPLDDDPQLVAAGRSGCHQGAH